MTAKRAETRITKSFQVMPFPVAQMRCTFFQQPILAFKVFVLASEFCPSDACQVRIEGGSLVLGFGSFSLGNFGFLRVFGLLKRLFCLAVRWNADAESD